LTALESTKFVFGPGSAPDSAVGAYRPEPLAGLRGAGTILIREGRKEEAKKGEGKRRPREW